MPDTSSGDAEISKQVVKAIAKVKSNAKVDMDIHVVAGKSSA